MSVSVNYNELADVIERFVNGTAKKWDWDDYIIGVRYKDPFLCDIQRRALAVSTEFPPGAEGGYTNSEGLAVLRGLADQLRSEARK
jgi:hypothetical protein